MTISYNGLKEIMGKTGHSFNSLKNKDVLPDYAGRKISAGQAVSLDHIEALCEYFNVPIEDIVEITFDESAENQSPESY